MSHSIIEVTNLSKSYTISHEGRESYTSLRDVIARKTKKIFSFPKSLTTSSSSKEEFWALKDINFNIEPGDRVGIIGRNGAGKSTLLKILSRITEPTTGQIKIKGRVASLLEVGTGFHPELSGRENIYLNGAILGMSRAEIKKHFDAIVDFAETEKFLDTPVKRYSSGMYVRLAFAVAAHLEPEILVVDEVLAVGDAEFQKKCLGKMEDVSKNEGRTVLFVSHNIAAISQLCSSAMLLKNGNIEVHGPTYPVVEQYLQEVENRNSKFEFNAEKEIFKSIYITGASILNINGKNNGFFCVNESVFIKLILGSKSQSNDAISIGIAITDKYDRRILVDIYENYKINNQEVVSFLIEIPDNTLTPGEYYIQIGLTRMVTGESLDFIDRKIYFEIIKENTRFEKLNYDYGIINKKFIWKEG